MINVPSSKPMNGGYLLRVVMGNNLEELAKNFIVFKINVITGKNLVVYYLNFLFYQTKSTCQGCLCV